MKIDVPFSAQVVMAKLGCAGFQAFIVGGCVRDSVLGRVPHDWDICTDALPENVIDIFGEANTIPTGIKHGTVSVKSYGEIYEVTTFRVDGEYRDGRHPETVTFVRTLKEDLARRDFTMNAMAWNPISGLVDPFGGVEDCQQHIIRAVGDPSKRFDEDALRILRAVRFSATFGFEIESRTLEAMCKQVSGLDMVSKERVGSEIFKIATAKFAGFAILQGQATVIRHVIPELDACYGCEQNNQYHYMDVFMHSITALENAEKCHRFPDSWADNYVRLALLLHDIGKPICKTTDSNGHDHFYGHTAVSGEMAKDVLKRLRFSNDIVDTVSELITYHGIEFSPRPAFARRMLNSLGAEQLHRLLKIRECDNRAHTQLAFLRFEEKTVPFAATLQKVLDEQDAFSLKDLAVNGNDIIQLVYPQGPQIGKILNGLLDAVITEKVENKKDALINYMKEEVK